MIQKALNLPFKQLLEMKTTSLFYNIPLHLTVTFKKFEKTANQNTSKKWNNWEVKRQRPEHSSLSLKTEVVTLCSAGPIFDRSSRPATGAQKCALSTLGQVWTVQTFQSKKRKLECVLFIEMETWNHFLLHGISNLQKKIYGEKRAFLTRRDLSLFTFCLVWISRFTKLSIVFFACYVLISVLSLSSKIKIWVSVQWWKNISWKC